jgi:excisionase family DNA binding protein
MLYMNNMPGDGHPAAGLEQRHEGQHDPLTITIKEAIRLSSLGRSFIYEKLSDGSIHSVKAARRRLIDYASFRKYLASLPTAGSGD